MESIFQALILGKYHVDYGRCPGCGLIQTETPYWLPEAYDQAVSAQDVGLVRRNMELSARLQDIILSHFDSRGRFLDYAGGYGLMVRMMRDAGFDFHRHDPLCANIFAQGFEIPELAGKRFELITTFELLEHLQEPVREVHRLLEHADSLLFSTRLQPDQTPKSAEDWWYFWPQTGQHITFYTLSALQILAEKTNSQLHSDGTALHLLTRRDFSLNPLGRPRGVVRLLERFLKRLLNSLRKRMYRVKPPASLLPEDSLRIATKPSAISARSGTNK
ncbi:hypothetical protein JCM31598_32320 [Desulfonatronum parangueonense]